jgi:hypothetical protein
MSAAKLDRVRGLRVAFGHQSVGANIVDGIRDLMAWRVVDAGTTLPTDGGFLAHGRYGQNGNPRSKTRAFCEAMAGPLGAQIDIALHKYCYVDIECATDVDALFADYRSAMRAVRAERPRVQFVHVTVPLVRVRTGVQAWVLGAMGRKSPRLADNARREAFNERLRREYLSREPVFDLAAAASRGTGPRSLRADYTHDGGHLNPIGRRAVADGLLALLAELSPN